MILPKGIMKKYEYEFEHLRIILGLFKNFIYQYYGDTQPRNLILFCKKHKILDYGRQASPFCEQFLIYEIESEALDIVRMLRREGIRTTMCDVLQDATEDFAFLNVSHVG